jgi:hypothetical protein
VLCSIVVSVTPSIASPSLDFPRTSIHDFYLTSMHRLMSTTSVHRLPSTTST